MQRIIDGWKYVGTVDEDILKEYFRNLWKQLN